MGVFIVLNVMTFTKTTAVLCVGYFVLAIVVCWGFGDRLMAKGAQRLLDVYKRQSLDTAMFPSKPFMKKSRRRRLAATILWRPFLPHMTGSKIKLLKLL